MATAPQCDLSPKVLPADPKKPLGFQQIPTNATLAQAIRIINYNFQQLSPFNSINFFGGNSPGARGQAGRAGSAGKNAKEGNWGQKDIVKQKVRIYQMGADGAINKNNFVDVERINSLTMTDKQTGATWVYKREGTDGPNIQLLPS